MNAAIIFPSDQISCNTGSPISYENGDPGSPFGSPHFHLTPELVGSQKTGKEIVRRASGPGKVALYPEAFSYRAEVSVPQPYAKTGETVATFVAELRQLSEFCEFGASLEYRLRDRLVCGIASGSSQRRLLAEPELTLQKAQNLAQAIESADKNAKDLQGQRQPPMTAVNAMTCKRGPPRGTRARTDAEKLTETPCYRCGGKHSPRDCRFKDAVCHSCKKRGHLARVCRSKRTQGTAAGRYDDGGKQPQQRHALHGKLNEQFGKRATSVHRIPREPSQVSVDGVPMTMELDTGAAVSVISEHTYHSTWPHDRPALQPSSIKLRTYSGEELEVIGSFSVQVRYEDQQEDISLLVV